MVKSTAIADAGVNKQTLYEVDGRDFNRATFERALESMNAVHDDIAMLIRLCCTTPSVHGFMFVGQRVRLVR